MLKIKCIKVFRDEHNRIIGYRIIDEHKRVNDVMADQLKEAIRSKTVTCTNLTLTTDNRLISKRNTNENNNIKYYRYEISDDKQHIKIGGLFKGINKVLEEIDKEASYGNVQAIQDYEYIDRLISKLEYNLKSPKIENSKAIFYYNELERNKIVSQLLEIQQVLNDYYYNMDEEILVNPDRSRVVYEDKQQIAILI